ncbi:MAG: hypothetical protein CR986_03195 [Ignavibacteriae bacterium]|nr:MAG: hypothetical protein CR986_03195 [Ignavibacteriota bacterium]
MATKPAPKVKNFSEDSLEKKVYSFIDTLEDKIPLMNDRNRLSFALLNYINGTGDSPLITIRNNKLTLQNTSREELAKIIEEKLFEIKK